MERASPGDDKSHDTISDELPRQQNRHIDHKVKRIFREHEQLLEYCVKEFSNFIVLFD